MEVTDLPLQQIQEARWNANQMDPAMRLRLRRSIQRFQLVVPLVVRLIDAPIGDLYETIGGAQRLAVVQELGYTTVPCVIVEADDVEARLLSQALNRIQGEDDPGLQVQLLQELLEKLPQAEVLNLLPETAQSLRALASLGQEDITAYLQSYSLQQAQGARLKHLTFQFTSEQLAVVEEALARVLEQAKGAASDNPNPRGNALALLCGNYLELIGRNS